MKIGIIANPEAGRDIRRIVSNGFVFTNEEKVNIVLRIFSSFDYFGIKEVLYMKDSFGIVEKAYKEGNFKFKIKNILKRPTFTGKDSTVSAKIMNEEEVGIIITLGGDGTNRDVSEGCKFTPLLPISTGTNNVFPFLIEGTIAGIAASIFVKFKDNLKGFLKREKKIILKLDNLNASSLIDLSLSKEKFIGSKAIWNINSIEHIFLTQGLPWNIGISSIGGFIKPIERYSDKGMYIKLGEGEKILSPALPGEFNEVNIKNFKVLNLNETVRIYHKGTIVLDGERTIELPSSKEVEIKITKSGPFTLDYKNLLLWASKERILRVSHRS